MKKAGRVSFLVPAVALNSLAGFDFGVEFFEMPVEPAIEPVNGRGI
jgi:hypothetical protein